uniref:Uncharacterized protein n=1 Tax=Candidatus Kentrum sp. DK TaxID=2126562 RepID=A0A450SD91_9GAMM|nr:MAG: hypothetical protein BECKDK2373B_GA0170837_102820 [Candidatus Kentron sp. DK]
MKKYLLLLTISISLALIGYASHLLYPSKVLSDRVDAAAFSISAPFVARLDDYGDLLSPDFKKITAEEALEKVLPTTSVTEQKILDALGVSLALGLQRKGGEETTAPENLDKTGLATLLERSPGASDSTEKLDTDPFLRYQAAMALFQEVRLLNDQIKAAALWNGMKAYIIRLQFNVVPFARSRPYDLYATVSFFPSTKTDGSKGTSKREENKGIRILPLLVTDNLETESASRSLDTIRQLSLAVNALWSGETLGGGLTKKQQQIDDIFAKDTNSLLTIGQVSANTARVRIGAARQASSRYAMIPRNHHVTLLMMVPEKMAEVDENKEDKNDVLVLAKWHLRDAETGERLEDHEERDVYDVVEEYLKEPGRISSEDCKKEIELKPGRVEDLLLGIYKGQLETFTSALNGTTTAPKGTECFDKRKTRNIWFDIAELIQRTNTAGATIELPEDEKPVDAPSQFPPAQAVVIEDDGKRAQIKLNGARNIRVGDLRATLLYNNNTFVASQVSFPPGNNGAMTLAFPSMRVWQSDKSGSGNAKLSFCNYSEKEGDIPKCDEGKDKTINLKLYYPKSDKPAEQEFDPVSVSLIPASRRIMADKGEGAISFQVKLENKKGGKKQAAKAAEIMVDGGEIVEVKADGKKISEKLNKFTVSSDSIVNLSLRNLTPGGELTITAVAREAKGKKKSGGAGQKTQDTLRIHVVAASS